MLSISLASLQAVNLPELFNILSALSVSAEVVTCFIFKDTSLGMYDVRRYNCHPFMYLTTKLA